MDDTSGIEHQPREGAEANVCVWYAIEGGFMLDRDRRYI